MFNHALNNLALAVPQTTCAVFTMRTRLFQLLALYYNSSHPSLISRCKSDDCSVHFGDISLIGSTDKEKADALSIRSRCKSFCSPDTDVRSLRIRGTRWETREMWVTAGLAICYAAPVEMIPYFIARKCFCGYDAIYLEII